MSLRRSFAFSLLEKYGSTSVNVVSTLILARLLTPAEIGVFSVGAALVGLMHTLRDFGITNYLIQERELGHDKIRTAFTVTLGLSWGMALMLVAASGWATRFYGEEGVRQVIWVLAANFALIPFGSPALALLRRELKFGRLAAIGFASAVVNAAVSVLMAALGFGFMSLAWASLAGVITTSGLAFLGRPRIFLLRPCLQEWRSVLSFGGYASANTLVSELRISGASLILGRMLGFDAVGLYSRTQGLLAIFNKLIFQGLQPVLLPALAQKVRRGEDLCETYLRAVEMVTVLYWPFLTFLALMADPIVRILLGDQWLGAVPLVRILCGTFALGFYGFLTQPLLISVGRIRQSLAINLVILPVSIAMIVAGALHSLEMVAGLTYVTAVVSLVATMVVVRRYVPFRLSELMRRIGRSALVTMVAAVSPIGAIVATGGAEAPIFACLLSAAGFVLLWALALFMFRHPFGVEMQRVLKVDYGRAVRGIYRRRMVSR